MSLVSSDLKADFDLVPGSDAKFEFFSFGNNDDRVGRLIGVHPQELVFGP